MNPEIGSTGTDRPAMYDRTRIEAMPITVPMNTRSRPVQPRVMMPVAIPAASRISGEMMMAVITQAEVNPWPTQPRFVPPNTATGQATAATTTAMRSRSRL
jgi:hypothetical protein